MKFILEFCSQKLWAKMPKQWNIAFEAQVVCWLQQQVSAPPFSVGQSARQRPSWANGQLWRAGRQHRWTPETPDGDPSKDSDPGRRLVNRTPRNQRKKVWGGYFWADTQWHLVLAKWGRKMRYDGQTGSLIWLGDSNKSLWGNRGRKIILSTGQLVMVNEICIHSKS